MGPWRSGEQHERRDADDPRLGAVHGRRDGRGAANLHGARPQTRGSGCSRRTCCGWRLGQPLYAGGALLAAIGVGSIAVEGPDAGRVLFWASSGLLVAGSLAWSLSAYLRAQRHRDFALGLLPGWPFVTYCWLTFAGLCLLGLGLLERGPAWLGWVVLVADAVFVAVYVATRDLPPFVFYALLIVVGVVVG